MSEICDELSADILRDCANPPAPGVEQKLVLFPMDNLVTYTQANGLVTAFALSSAGFTIDGIKDIMNYQNSFVNPADAISGLKHGLFGIRILDPSVEIRHEINAILTGGRKYGAVLKRRWAGTGGEDAFLIFGPTYGLEVPDGGLIDNSNENDGTMVLTLSTPEIFKEPRVPDVLLLAGGLAATQTAFDNAFAP